jgi:flagellar assembly factor FliW
MVTIHRIDDSHIDTGHADNGAMEQTILFPNGLVGCPDWRRFGLAESELPGVYLLESRDDPSICFTLYAIDDIDTDYRLKLHADDAETLRVLGAGEEAVRLYCTLTVHNDGTVTANLLGPIVIDHARGSAVQVVVSASPFSTRYLLYSGAE